MKNALILGGNGFIGASLSQKLVDIGYHVTAVDKKWGENTPHQIKCVTADVFSSSVLDELLPGTDVVFHLVSTTIPGTSNTKILFDCESNVAGTIKIMDAMVKHKIKQIVYASSGGTVYGIPTTFPVDEESATNPISAYGVGKLAIEKYLQLYSHTFDIKAKILRLSNPYGPGQKPESGQGIMATFIERVMCDNTIEVWGDGSVVRDYVYIDDVIQAFVDSLDIEEKYILLNIGSGEGYSIIQIINTIEQICKKVARVEYKPARKVDVPMIVLDINKAHKTLGYYPKFDLHHGVELFVDYFRRNKNS